jgi:hypothetical protein
MARVVSTIRIGSLVLQLCNKSKYCCAMFSTTLGSPMGLAYFALALLDPSCRWQSSTVKAQCGAAVGGDGRSHAGRF